MSNRNIDDKISTMFFNLGMTMSQIRRSRSESHSDTYDPNDDEDELFIPRSSKNGISTIYELKTEIF